jgi:hypothetical protein
MSATGGTALLLMMLGTVGAAALLCATAVALLEKSHLQCKKLVSSDPVDFCSATCQHSGM